MMFATFCLNGGFIPCTNCCFREPSNRNIYTIPYDIQLQSHHRASTYHEVAAHLMKRLMDQNKDHRQASVTVGGCWDSVPRWIRFAICTYLHVYDITSVQTCIHIYQNHHCKRLANVPVMTATTKDSTYRSISR